MNCWKCGHSMELPEGLLSFRAECEACHAWLHCCKNCRHYAPGKPNDCAIPGTDPIRDREASNHCEEFSLKGKGPTASRSIDEASKKLFGEPTNDRAKKNFNDLFGS